MFGAGEGRPAPSEPHAVAFGVYLPGEAEAVGERALRAVESEGVGLPVVWRAADVPGWCWTELTVGASTLAFDVDEAADRIAVLADVDRDVRPD